MTSLPHDLPPHGRSPISAEKSCAARSSFVFVPRAAGSAPRATDARAEKKNASVTHHNDDMSEYSRVRPCSSAAMVETAELERTRATIAAAALQRGTLPLALGASTGTAGYFLGDSVPRGALVTLRFVRVLRRRILSSLSHRRAAERTHQFLEQLCELCFAFY